MDVRGELKILMGWNLRKYGLFIIGFFNFIFSNPIIERETTNGNNTAVMMPNPY